MDAALRRIVSRTAGILLLAWGPSFLSSAATGTIRDVQHVVILMMENRSFDHYYGSLGGVRGFNDPNALILTNGLPVFYQPQSNGFVLPFHSPTQCLGDVSHDEITGLEAWDAGWWDEWVSAKGTNSMAYFTREDLPYYYALADAYTICDAYHSSVLGPTYPNRLYLMSGMIDPNGTGGGPVLGNRVPTNGFSWTTYPERLQNAGVSWRVYESARDYFNLNALAWFSQYRNATPGTTLYDRGRALVPDVVSAFQADVSNGTLPSVSWIIPDTLNCEHPCLSPSFGEMLTQQLLSALASNPAVFNSTVFFLTYDENGGFFDHVPPPIPPPGTADEFVNGQPIGLGVRVPMLIVSPWTRGGHVCSEVFDHTSLLRFLERWTGVPEPNLSSWRRVVCGDLTSAFDFSTPDTNFPALSGIALTVCSNGVYPAPPQPQVVPTPETGLRASRLLPYQPNASCLIEHSNSRIRIELTNSGKNSAHFSVYASDQPFPRQFDLPRDASVIDWYPLSTNPADVYDVSCYGPNGFLRRFAGSLGSNWGMFELRSALDLNAVGIAVALTNWSTSTISVTISNGLQPADVRSYVLSPSSSFSDLFPALTNNGKYDLSATTAADPRFIRRLAGRIEIGYPKIRVRRAGAMLQLSYPAWAASYGLESLTDLIGGQWQPVTGSSTALNDGVTVTLPMPDGTVYFRLHR